MQLADLDVLVVDCQASGATPAHGDLIEIGWAVTGSRALATSVRAHWVKPSRNVPRAVRQLTGWSERCLDESVDAAHAWMELMVDADRIGRDPIPTVIHFARFERPFLRALHEATNAHTPYPFETICLHAIAQRLFPDLPRRNIRALAGLLGHSPSLVRRSAGHVDASAHIWRALVPRLAELGVRTWEDLAAFVAEKPAPYARGRASKRGFPLPAEKRRSLPDAPGVYRFVRPNGDVLYVGKAASLKKRVSSHYTGSSRATERALEMLSQVHDVIVTETPSILEAAVLETDEIKRIDPPYNVQLRAAEREIGFASLDYRSVAARPDDVHVVGPLPSRGSLSGLAALRSLLEGSEPFDHVRAAAVGVPRAFTPPRGLFQEVWDAFAREHLLGDAPSRARLLRAGARIVVSESDPDEPDRAAWDAASVRRYLERTLHGGAAVVRRATRLCLLAHSIVAFHEPSAKRARVLEIRDAEIVARDDTSDVDNVRRARLPPPPPRRTRQEAFDATRYDRLRVLVTELRRVVDGGGAVVVRVGSRTF